MSKSKNFKIYQAYGLTFSSPFYLPFIELTLATDEKSDIEISYGEVPEKLANPSLVGALWSEENGKFLLRVEDVARFLIVGNSQIIVELEDESKERDARRFLLGSVLGVMLHQRGIVILRASALKTEKGAVIFLGFSGTGKTTFLYSNLQKGAKMLADEKTAILLGTDGQVKAAAGYAEMALNTDVVHKFKIEVDETRLNREIGKYYYHATSFEPDPAPIRAIYWLENHNGDELEIEEITDYNYKFNLLNSFIYLNPYPFNPLQKINYFRVFTEIAKSVAVTRIKYSLKINQYAEIEKKLAEDLAK